MSTKCQRKAWRGSITWLTRPRGSLSVCPPPRSVGTSSTPLTGKRHRQALGPGTEIRGHLVELRDLFDKIIEAQEHGLRSNWYRDNDKVVQAVVDRLPEVGDKRLRDALVGAERAWDRAVEAATPSVVYAHDVQPPGFLMPSEEEKRLEALEAAKARADEKRRYEIRRVAAKEGLDQVAVAIERLGILQRRIA